MRQVKIAPTAALIFILGVAAALRVFFFTGYHGQDDIHYIRRAFELSQGGFTPPASHWATRIGLVGPTALFYRAFGVSPLTTNAFPFLCSLLSVVAAFVLGRRLYDARSGLIAAFLVAIFPMDVIFASMLFPTEPVVLFSGVGLGCFVLAERERKPGLYLAGGLSLGLAGVAHEAALMILAIYPVYAFVVARPARAHLWVVVGIALAFGIDPLIHGLMGDPWVRISAALAHVETDWDTGPDLSYRGANLAWIGEPLVRLFVERTFGLFPWLIAPAVAFRLWKPVDGSDRALAFIIAAGFLWLAYGTLSPIRYAPLARVPRFFAPLVLPAMWLLGHELAERFSRRAQYVTLLALAINSVACLMLDSGSALVPYEELRAVLARAQPAEVVIERQHEFPLLFAEGFKPRYALSKLDDAAPQSAVVVVASDAARERVERLPGVALMARITPPETLYLKLLRTRFVTTILRATRPAPRFEGYAKKTEPWALWVYRVP
jgi:4-amino-4-deoxy-L-arabinose transferase-like glycosyltransferase